MRVRPRGEKTAKAAAFEATAKNAVIGEGAPSDYFLGSASVAVSTTVSGSAATTVSGSSANSLRGVIIP